MANLSSVLHHVVTDVESKQTIAAFATRQTAELWADAWETKTGRKAKVSDTRRRSDQGTGAGPTQEQDTAGPTE